YYSSIDFQARGLLTLNRQRLQDLDQLPAFVANFDLNTWLACLATFLAFVTLVTWVKRQCIKSPYTHKAFALRFCRNCRLLIGTNTSKINALIKEASCIIYIMLCCWLLLHQ